ncbi:MAG TPA: redoxin family protein [Verrucomicrobiales bacterium]|nr:redoxin family protein [Verrucomicrobiales bacterium]
MHSVLCRQSSLRALIARTLASAVLLLPFALKAADSKVPVGAQAGKFTVTDIRFSPRTLDDFGKPKAFVLVFTSTGCPLVQRYLPKLKEFSAQYGGKGVQFIGVNEATDDSLMDVARQALEYGVEFPFVKDFGGECARALGVTRTPEAVILNEDRKICYRGRIDDQHRLGGDKPAVGRADLQEAIEEVLAGRKVSVEETAVDGCAISFPQPPPEKTTLTYAKDIAPLLNKHCVECHRPGTAAPFSLTEYEKVAAKAGTIAEVVETRQMPPWFAHPGFGKFINHRGLSAAERSTITQWARGGKPAGDLSLAPKPPEFSSAKWEIGEPDLVITAAGEEKIPATGYIPYRYVILPYIFPHDTWVQGIEIMPGNPKVVHHANLAFAKVTEKFDQDRNFLTGKVPGGIAVNLKSGVAMMIPRGSVLAFQIHYVTTGKEETDRISVGLRYAREPVDKRVRYKIIDNGRFKIPPGASAHPVMAEEELECDATGIALFCHMHLRGKDTTFTARYPDGKSETLLCMPNYSFGWQLSYVWENGKQRFPKGTKIECLSHFDNSPFNPFNPDPAATVKYGPQTFHEMMQGFFFYTDDAEHLNLKVDPKNGKEIKDDAKSTAAK